jgi:hypothetical protein
LHDVMFAYPKSYLGYLLGRLPWRRGIVTIASAYWTEDPGFKSRQGVKFLGIYIHCSAVVITQYALSLWVLEREKNFWGAIICIRLEQFFPNWRTFVQSGHPVSTVNVMILFKNLSIIAKNIGDLD